MDIKNVEVELSGEKRELKPTLEAMRRVNAYRGGLRNALEAVSNADLDAVALVIGAGLGMKRPEDFEAVAQSIYREGLVKFTGPATDFCVRLANGGRDPSADADADKESPKGNG
jgi:hypothetical protein